MKKKILFIALSFLVLAGCSHGAAKPEDMKGKANLSYNVNHGDYFDMKYPGVVGVLNLLDKRALKFYKTDDLLKGDVKNKISNNLFLELRSSGLFANVVKVNEETPEYLDNETLKRIADKNGVDFIFVSELTSFNLVRDLSGDINANNAQVGVKMGLVSQLIYPDVSSSLVIWGDSLEVMRLENTTNGMVNAGGLSNLVKQAMKGIFSDMKAMIYRTGRNMR